MLTSSSSLSLLPFTPIQPWNPRRHRNFSPECRHTLRALAMGIMRLKRGGASGAAAAAAAAAGGGADAAAASDVVGSSSAYAAAAAAIGGAASAAAPSGLPPVLPPLVHVDPACIEWVLEGVSVGWWNKE